MCAMKNIQKLLLAAAIAVVASGCTSAYFSSVSAYDDLYATHDVKAIAERQKAEAEVRKAEAEALKAEAEARAAQLKAENLENQNSIAALTAALNASLQSNNSTVHVKVTDDGLLITDDDIVAAVDNSYVANTYESAYARRLKGFSSPTYRMPSSYFNLRYNSSHAIVTAYDPALYNIMVSGDEVWVEPKYITSMFGTWGAINATIAFSSPWYYGWRSWGAFDPWYYRSCWGFPRYSWWDWNWHMCYGDPYYYRWTGSLGWWGWGGMYCPSYYHWGWHYPHHHGHWGGSWGHSYYGWGGGWAPAPPRPNAPRLEKGPNPNYDRGGSIYGSRNQNTNQGGRNNGSIVNRGSSHSTPYRSPSNGTTYGNGSRGKSATAAIQQQRAAEASRAASVGRSTSRSTGRSSYSNSSSSSSRNNVSINRSSSSSSSSSYSSGGGSSYSGGGSSGGGGGSRSGGGSSGGGGGVGSRGR